MDDSDVPSRIDEVIGQVGLEVKRDLLIKGLSRGMKQRLGIARAVIHRPKLLLLDEPASGLDPKARLDLRHLLRLLRDQGTTILISSHILTELEGFCTSIGVMERGRMVRSGRIDEMVGEQDRSRGLRLGWLGDYARRVEEVLRRHIAVSQVRIEDRQAILRFEGSEEDQAAVLRDLVAAGITLRFFAEVQQTVEDLYLKLSH